MQRTYQFTEMGPTRAEGSIFEMLVEAGRRQSFTDGQQVLHIGDQGKGFWLIENGQLMACRFGREGERILYGVLGKGDLIGELACFANLKQQMNATVEGNADLVWIETSQIDTLLAKEPKFARWLLSSMAHKLRAALNRIESDQNLSAKARTARALANMATSEGGELDITQQQLADFIGVSRVTVGQVLAELARDGLIKRQYRQLIVIDPLGLAAHFERN